MPSDLMESSLATFPGFFFSQSSTNRCTKISWNKSADLHAVTPASAVLSFSGRGDTLHREQKQTCGEFLQ